MKTTSRFIAIFLFVVSISAQAQVGINPTGADPDNSAMLDVSAANKGLLIPRIALTGTTDVTTIVTPAASLLVYNTATVSDVTPGFYYYNGAAWKRLVSGTETDPVFTSVIDVSGSLTGDFLKYDGTKFVKFTPNFTESNYSFNARYGVKLLARNDAQANVNFVLSPKGNGAILAKQPDGTSAGGMNRGQYAVDLQISRMSSSMVSSGDGSVVGGGENNTANGTASVVPGGSTNSANGNYSTASGIGNNSSGLASTTFGQGNTALGFYSFAAGKDNSASGIGSTATGQGNTALGNNTFATGIGSIAFSDGEAAVGNYPTTYTVANNITDRVFVVGNGTGTGSRSNAFVIQKNANTTIGGLLTINGNGMGTSVELPATRGTSGYVLTTNGSGGTNWTAPSVGTVTGVTGTAPIVSSGGAAPAISISAATTSAAGSMSAADKTKLDGLQAGWNLAGNAGTTPGTDFIGTTDNKALLFKVYNSKSGEINSDTYNTSLGYQALNSITLGFSNTANGSQALYSNTTGYQNTANGYMALYSNTTGNNNTGVGIAAGRDIVGGTNANSTSSNSVYLGALTKALANAQTNEIVIGFNTTGAGSNTVTLGNTSIATTVLRGNVRHYGTTSGYIGLQSPAAPTSYSLTLPIAAPATDGQVLSATTAGVMSWATPVSGTVTAVSGTAPIVSSGGNTPAISISAATSSAAGSMSAADKAELDAATNANTAGTIVARDASGNFSAGTITAALTGNATTATTSTNITGGAVGSLPYQTAANTTTLLTKGTAGQVLTMNSGATAPQWSTPTNGTVTSVTGAAPISVATGTTTPAISISAASTSAAGSMSAADKTKLDGIATNANNYIHPTGDGNLHVPATSTTNNGKVLTAGSTAGSLSWTSLPSAPVTSVAGKTGTVTLVSSDVGLGNVENTAISTWTGSANITTLGTITTGTWSGNSIGITKGGTGAITKTAGFDALSPMTTQGDIIYGGTSGTGTRLAKGAAGQVLTMNSGATAPQWSTPTTGTVTSVSGISPISVATGTTTPAISISPASTSAAGSMSAADKVKLNGIDGSETRVTAGTNVVITGNGTTATPYVVNVPGVATALAIGQSYQGGIIFWLDATGQHGLIAATTDNSTMLAWNHSGILRQTGSTGDGLYAGSMNTAMIVATQMAENQNENFAAKACADYSVTVGGVPYGDWYLPSKYELNLLYLQKDAVGGFGTSIYLSSTEYDATSEWAQYFSNGDQLFGDKNFPGRIRAIRAF